MNVPLFVCIWFRDTAVIIQLILYIPNLIYFGENVNRKTEMFSLISWLFLLWLIEVVTETKGGAHLKVYDVASGNTRGILQLPPQATSINSPKKIKPKTPLFTNIQVRQLVFKLLIIVQIQ